MKENSTKKLYKKNYLNWSRDKPICLSDFTAREKIFKLVGKLNNEVIADLGCGEGYASRIFIKKGAKKVYGIDISHKMIELAKLKEKKKILYKKANITKTQLPDRSFDKTFAIFVFNYLKKKQMMRACKEIHRITKKGGLIYISVPHPFYPFLANKNNIFYFENFKGEDYLKKIDHVFKGFIKRLDNIKLPVHFTHHTLQDYFDCFKLANLNKVKEIHELKVTKMHLKKNNKFFNNIKDLPLHLLFILEK